MGTGKEKEQGRLVKLLGQVLICDEVVVDETMLDLGIYPTSRPVIFWDHEVTIESLINKAKYINENSSQEQYPKEYIENLKRCHLEPVEIKFLLEE